MLVYGSIIGVRTVLRRDSIAGFYLLCFLLVFFLQPCGTRIWLFVSKEYGIEEVLGIDGDWLGKETLQIPEEGPQYP